MNVISPWIHLSTSHELIGNCVGEPEVFLQISLLGRGWVGRPVVSFTLINAAGADHQQLQEDEERGDDEAEQRVWICGAG